MGAPVLFLFRADCRIITCFVRHFAGTGAFVRQLNYVLRMMLLCTVWFSRTTAVRKNLLKNC